MNEGKDEVRNKAERWSGDREKFERKQKMKWKTKECKKSLASGENFCANALNQKKIYDQLHHAS